MGITVYSLAISIVFYNLALIAVFILRRSPVFRAKHAVSLLAFVTALGVLRLILPIDLDAAYVVRSYKIIPAIEDFLRRPLLGALTPGALLLLVWLTGSVVTLIRKLCVRRKFDHSLGRMDFVDKPRVLEIAGEFGGNFAVLISPQLRDSYTSGILHPVIYLPDLDLSDDEWRMIFRHEVTHICSRDNLKKLFFLLVETVFWWNPLAHFSGDEVSTLLELRCDAKVTAEMDERERCEYAALLKKLMNLHDPRRTPDPVSTLVGGEPQMRQRIITLLQPQDDRRPRYIVITLLLLVFVFSYFAVVQPIRFPTDEMFVDTADNTVYYMRQNTKNVDPQIAFENGTYRLYFNDEYAATINEDEVSEMASNAIPVLGGK